MGVQHHSAVKNLTVERLVRLPDDPGPSFPGVLACTFGAWLRLAQRLRPALSWYHFLIVFGVATHGLAELWTDRPASRLTNIKGGPTIVVSFPSSAHSISYFAIHPSQSSIIPSLSTLLPSNTMSSFAASDDIPYSIPSYPSSDLDYPRPTHSYGLRPRVPAMRGNGGRPALRSTRAVANAPVARRNGPNRRPAPARQPNRQASRQPNRRGPARGCRNGPVVSPARGVNSGGLRSNRFVLTPRSNEPVFYRTPYQTPHRRGHHQTPSSPTWSFVQRRMAPSPNRPPSPTWADVLRNPAPNQNSPLFRPVVPNTPPGLRMVMDLPEPEVPPFVLGQAALDDIFMYLQGNDAVADPEPEVPPVPIVPDAEPAGFEPSQTAIHWADHRHTSISSDHSDSKSSRPSTADTTESNSYQDVQFHRLNDEQIHLLLGDHTRINRYNVDRFSIINNENKYLFVAIGFINYCLRHPSANWVIQRDRVVFFRMLMYLRL
ncbi:hypothetical protein KEM48_003699 [Puccinia striiformis f. sp. tritici PST-130]|nr:hypothetical protein KEM48_003699 [Puccinia striiformis f. sp. tritici PST-130]